MKTIVYTANYGNMDAVRPPLILNKDVEYRYYTDQVIQSNTWDVHHMKVHHDPHYASRIIKMLPETIMPEAEYWIYHDANRSLLVDPEHLVDEFLVRTYSDIALFNHPHRQSIVQEAEAVVGKMVSTETSLRLMATYRWAGFDVSHGLYDGAFLIRKNTEKVRAFNRMWWSHVALGCHRDQMSLPFCLWSMGMNVTIIPGSYIENDYLDFQSHIGEYFNTGGGEPCFTPS